MNTMASLIQLNEQPPNQITLKTAMLHMKKSFRAQCSQLNFSFVSAIHEPSFGRLESNLFLIVLIPSGIGTGRFLERRNNIRSTWANNTNGSKASKEWKYVFVLGQRLETSSLDNDTKREAATYNDILVFNTTDTYRTLIVKTFSAFLWALVTVNPRFVLKADDDIYVRLPYLVSWLTNYGNDWLYGGSIIKHGKVLRSEFKNEMAEDCLGLDYYPPYCIGSGYVVSSNALRFMFQSMKTWTPFPVEDAYMGVLANENGFAAINIPGFYLRINMNAFNKCKWASAVALGHNFNRSDFDSIQRKLRQNEELPRDYDECALRHLNVQIPSIN